MASHGRRRELFERGRRLLADALEEARWMVLVVADGEGREALSVSMIDGVEGAP